MASRAGAATAESQGAPESQDAPTASDGSEKGALARLWAPRWKLTVPGGVFRRDVTKLLGRKRVRFWGSL